MSGIAALDREYECGTRSAYVRGCRCAACRDATRLVAKERTEKLAAAREDVKPTGPAIESTMRRGGREVRILRCPGANGAACVRSPAAWLKGATVCTACVDRAAVWNGLVSPARAREHLRALSIVGVGYKAVADASDVGNTTLARIISGDNTPIRARVERAILAVDEGARADHAPIDAAETNARIAWLLARGFTRRHVARLLGYSARTSSLQIGDRSHVLAATAAKVARLVRRVEAGEVTAERATVAGTEERAFLSMLLDCGVNHRWLAERLGFHVQRSTRRMLTKHALAVRALRAELETIRREGAERPDGWEASPTAITAAFGFDGGWSWGGASPGGRRKAKPKPKAPPKPRPIPMTADERRARCREAMRARRAALPIEAVREQNRRDARRMRARRSAERAQQGQAAA